METSQDGDRDGAAELNPFQFSVGSLLIVCLLLAICLSNYIAGEELARFLTILLLTIAVPMVLTVALVYGRGYLRTCCIGALFPAVVSLALIVYEPRVLGELKLVKVYDYSPQQHGAAFLTALAGYVGTIAVFGFLAILVRWRLEGPIRAQSKKRATSRPSVSAALTSKYDAQADPDPFAKREPQQVAGNEPDTPASPENPPES